MSSALTCIPVVKYVEGPRPFYLLDGFRYDLNFPLAWALNHLAWDRNPNYLSGPKHCEYCRTTGCINEVFISYCFNCQKHIYNGKRLTPIDGMTQLPPAIYHWQMDKTTLVYGLDKDVITQSGILPSALQEKSDDHIIDIAEDFEDFDIKHADYCRRTICLK